MRMPLPASVSKPPPNLLMEQPSRCFPFLSSISSRHREPFVMRAFTCSSVSRNFSLTPPVKSTSASATEPPFSAS